VLRLLGLVISIGLADSINPSTIAPALYLASGERPRARVAEFTIAVFAVYLAGGALITLGPGQLIRSAVPDLDVAHTVRHVAELVAGFVLIAAAVLVPLLALLAVSIGARSAWRRHRRERVLDPP